MSRRGQGEGSIYQDTAGRWRGFVDLGWADGRRRRKYVTATTRKETAAKVRQLQDQRESGALTRIRE